MKDICNSIKSIFTHNVIRFIAFLLAMLFLLNSVLAEVNSEYDYINSNLFSAYANDTIGVQKLLELAKVKLENEDTDSAIFYGNQAYQLSLKNSFEKDIGQSQLIIARAYNFKKAYPIALSYYIRSIDIFYNTNNNALLAKINYEIGLMYSNWEVYEKAIEYYRISNSLSLLNFKEQNALYESMAKAFLSLNYSDSAIFYNKKVLEFYENEHNLEMAIGALEFISGINKNLKRYQQAIENEKQILVYYKEMRLVEGEIKTLNNLGFLYKYINDVNQSLEFFIKAIELCDACKLKASINNNIGIIYYNLGNLESALLYMNKALNINQSNKDLLETAKSYNLLATTYFSLQDFETAINYAKMAIEIGEKITNANLLYQSYLILSNIYRDNGDFELALDYYIKYSEIKLNLLESNQDKEAELLARTHTAEKTEKELKLYIAEEELKDLTLKQLLLEKEKREKELLLQKENNALLNRKYILEKATAEQRIQLINQKLDAEKKDRQISDLNTEKRIQEFALKQKEIEKKEQEKEIELLATNNTLLEQEKQLDELKLQRSKSFRNQLVAAIFVIVIILLLIVYYYLRKIKTNRILRTKNLEINQQKISIERQAKELHEANQNLIELDRFKESLTGMIVHDLKNPLNSLLNTTQIEKVKTLANKMLLMVMNILDIQKFEDAALELNLSSRQLSAEIDKSIEQVISAATEKNITIENNISNNLTALIDADIVERIVVNLLTNAIKYTPVNGSIKLNANTCADDFLKIEVTDTGQGIPKDKLHLVFEKFGQVDAKKLGITRSSGLGLTFCKLATEAHGGVIGVDSILGEGSTFWLTLKRTKDVVKDESPESKIESSDGEISASTFIVLKPFIISLQNIKYYQITELRKILSQIDESVDQEVKTWKDKLTKAISSGNKQLYEELIKLDNDGS